MNDGVGRAVEVLREGGLVAFPTETVYGLGADATNEAAVRRIFEVKRRPADHPVIVHLASGEQMSRWAASVPRSARELAASLWPGPLTLLVDRGADVLDVVTGARATVGLRVPDQPLALELLQAFGEGIAAPSANRFGKVSPTTSAHVRADLGDEVAVVLDGGACAVGVESTIVDCTLEPPMVLRPGSIGVERLAEVLGRAVQEVPAGPSRAPGMMASHYAPSCRVELAADRPAAEERAAALRDSGLAADVLAPEADSAAYARHLYGWLRDADARALDVLVAVLPADDGIGRAVRDRLSKAAAVRPTVEDAG